MPKIYRISRSGLRLFYKIRHHRGHGIHSPFVFRLVTRVIEEKNPYYAYGDISNIIHNTPDIYKKPDKYNHLSFRLINYFNAKKILELGSGEGINSLFLSASSIKAECVCVELSADKRQKAKTLYENWDRKIILQNEYIPLTQKQDCIFINLYNFNTDFKWINEHITPLTDENSFIIIKGIRTKRKSQALWKQLIAMERVTLSLDLYNEGIIFFKPKLHKRNYAISF